jgi:hypothetical protein
MSFTLGTPEKWIVFSLHQLIIDFILLSYIHALLWQISKFIANYLKTIFASVL